MLKKILPNSLFGRFLLIILLPNIIVQLVTVYMFYERHWSGVSKHMSVALAGEISMVVKNILDKPVEERERFLKNADNTLYLDMEFIAGKKLEKMAEYKPAKFDALISELNSRLSMDYLIYYLDSESRVAIDIQLNNDLLHITSSKKRLANPSTYIFIMWMTGTALVFLMISILFMRNQVKAISKLDTVAEKFGKGQDTADFKPTGAAEVRQVAQAFIDMRERINRQVEQRTEMLAGVSHDLKTPLTRIKLQLSMMPPSKEIKELQNDIVEMEKMVQGYLDFAKGKERVIDASVNISDLLRSVIAGYRTFHKNIELKSKTGIVLHINSNAFRRVITNILDNALRYGKAVKVNMTSSEKNLIIMIDDDGPGIPQKKRELVFKPFYKIDRSRNLESGGTGLGLAIAKDIIIGYGGNITLDESPIGGLRVMIKLPL